jgi:hypothetical protein
VWVRALANKEPYRRQLDRLLDAELVLRHDLVYGELLIGDAGARARTLATYLDFARVDTVAHSEVVDLVRARSLYGTGVSWIDVHLLAAAMVNRVQLYTADAPLEKHAKAFAVNFVPKG